MKLIIWLNAATQLIIMSITGTWIQKLGVQRGRGFNNNSEKQEKAKTNSAKGLFRFDLNVKVVVVQSLDLEKSLLLWKLTLKSGFIVNLSDAGNKKESSYVCE